MFDFLWFRSSGFNFLGLGPFGFGFFWFGFPGFDFFWFWFPGFDFFWFGFSGFDFSRLGPFWVGFLLVWDSELEFGVFGINFFEFAFRDCVCVCGWMGVRNSFYHLFGMCAGDYDKFCLDEGEQKIKVEKIVAHPHYHDYTFDSDIALLYLAQPVVFSSVVSPVCLPNVHLAKRLERPGENGLVSGWGATSYRGRASRFLMKVSLPLVDQKDCMDSTDQVITDNMFCAGYLHAVKDACSGDSGGPFVVNYRGTWFLTGVVSWGEQCAADGKYGVYTRISNFLDWIGDEMKKHEETISKNNKKTSTNSTLRSYS